MKLAETNEICWEKSIELFKVHYGEAIFKIFGPFNTNYESGVYEIKGLVLLQHPIAMKSTLSNFGEFITRIQISFEKFTTDQFKEIIHSIDSQRFNALKELGLENCPKMFEFETKFTSVRSLTFSRSQVSWDIGLETFKFNEFFPNVEQFSVRNVDAANWKQFDGEWSKLMEFSVQLSKSSGKNDQDTIYTVDFIRNIPTIKVLRIENCSLKLLKEVKHLLPHLQHLEIKGLSDNYLNHEGESLQFNDLNYFMIESLNDDQIPNNIALDALHKLVLIMQQKFNSEKWMAFIVKQAKSNLKELSLNAQDLSKEHILTILKQMPSLNNVDFICDSTFAADDIKSFIEKGEHLNKLKVQMRMIGEEQAILKGNLPDDWIMESIVSINSESDSIKLSFKR